jgi:hypothetical protein
VSDVQTLSAGEMALGRQAMCSETLRKSVDRALAAHGGLLSAAARAEGCSVEEMADRALMSGALDVADPRVSVMASPVARAAVGLPVGLADGAERRLAERLMDPSEAARRAADLLAEAEREASGVDLVLLRAARLGLLSLAEIGGDRAAAGLGLVAPILEKVGLDRAKIAPERAAEAFGLACAFVEAERSARARARVAVRGAAEGR